MDRRILPCSLSISLKAVNPQDAATGREDDQEQDTCLKDSKDDQGFDIYLEEDYEPEGRILPFEASVILWRRDHGAPFIHVIYF